MLPFPLLQAFPLGFRHIVPAVERRNHLIAPFECGHSIALGPRSRYQALGAAGISRLVDGEMGGETERRRDGVTEGPSGPSAPPALRLSVPLPVTPPADTS